MQEALLMEACQHASEERESGQLQGRDGGDLNILLFRQSSSPAGLVAAATDTNPPSGKSQSIPLILFTSSPVVFLESVKNAGRRPISFSRPQKMLTVAGFVNVVHLKPRASPYPECSLQTTVPGSVWAVPGRPLKTWLELKVAGSVIYAVRFVTDVSKNISRVYMFAGSVNAVSEAVPAVNGRLSPEQDMRRRSPVCSPLSPEQCLQSFLRNS
ncbi:hypothetical protein ACLOJK_004663 [Asimina triloba]